MKSPVEGILLPRPPERWLFLFILGHFAQKQGAVTPRSGGFTPCHMSQSLGKLFKNTDFQTSPQTPCIRISGKGPGRCGAETAARSDAQPGRFLCALSVDPRPGGGQMIPE